MSYIFEALKKLEQKRQREKASRLLLVTEDSGPESKKWPFWTLSLLSVLLLLNAILMFWWLRPWKPHASLPATPAQTVPATAARGADAGQQEQTQSASLKEPPQSERVSRPAPPAAEKTASRPPQPSPDTQNTTRAEANAGRETKPPATSRILNIADLPPAIKTSLPELKISAHFYADDPQSRFTRINDANLREGQTFTGGITLEKITPEGVVLSYQGYRFQLGIR